MKFVFLAVLVLACPVAPCEGSIIDMLPFLSQLKSLVQAIAGDIEGARRTQLNFLDMMPVVSQMKSLVQAASGDEDGARRTQLTFLHNLEDIVDATPGVGHVKGSIHIAAGDEERGLHIIKSATSTTGAVVGAVVMGPAGAVVGAAAADSVISVVDTAVSGEPRPFGIIDYLSNIDNADAGQHFDVVAGIGLDVGGGVLARRAKSKPTKFGRDRPRGVVDEEFIHNWGPDDMQFELSPRSTLQKARTRVDLPETHRKRLELVDFKDVNDVDGMTNCYICTLAATEDMSVTQLAKKYGIDLAEITEASTMARVVDIYKYVGYSRARAVFTGNAFDLHVFINKNVINQMKIYALAYDYSNGSGHVVLLRAWRDSGNLKYLVTDFQRPVYDPARFRRVVQEKDIKTYYLIDFGEDAIPSS